MAEKKPTRIQTRNREKILNAARTVFAAEGYRGATIDAIAEMAQMSKPNLLYYFSGKEEIYLAVLRRMLEAWLDPLRDLNPDGEPAAEIAAYIDRKIEMSRDHPQESRIFANEMLRGAPMLRQTLSGELRPLVEEKSALLRDWMAEGRLTRMDPRHLIFAIWSTTQHYADFDVQVRNVLGDDGEGRFNDAAATLKTLFLTGLTPR